MVAQVYCCGQPTVAGFKAALEKVNLQLQTTKWLAANSPDSEWYQDCKKNYFELKALLVKRKAQREPLGDSCQMCHHCYISIQRNYMLSKDVEAKALGRFAG